MGKLWKEFTNSENRISLWISLAVALAVIYGTISSHIQNKKNNEQTVAVKEKIDLLVSEHKKEVDQIMAKHDTFVSREISDLNKNTKRVVKRNGEMVLGETVRMIVASHRNIDRALEDAYEQAIDEGEAGGYIFEINQASGGIGSGVFVTELYWRSDEGSTKLLTAKEKADIKLYLNPYFEKVKREKAEDEFVSESTQEDIFWFLLRESGIGCITEPLEYRIPRQTAYHEKKIEVLTPAAKLGAVIGHIGDKFDPYREAF